MNHTHRFRRWLAAALAALLCAGVCSGCKNAQEAAVPVEKPIVVKNSGKESTLVLGGLALTPEREAALREIADKYTADFPNTVIEVRSYSGAEEMEEALRAGEVQIAEVERRSQLALVQKELLLNLRPYLEGWEEFSTLAAPAKAVLDSMGSENYAYLFPNDYRQLLLYYRTDWLQQYNEGKAWADTVNVENWANLLKALNALEGDAAGHGQVLLPEGAVSRLFDSILWSSLGTAALADAGAGYFTAPPPEQEVTGKTIFTSSAAPAAAETFQSVLEHADLYAGLDSPEAVEAFCSGGGAVLIADRSVLPQLAEKLPEGSFAAQGLPQGESGTTVTELSDFTGWGIAANTEDWESAFHFLSFLSNADNNTHYAKVCGALPIHLVAEDLEGSLAEGELAPEMEMISKGNQYQYAWTPVRYEAGEGWREESTVKINDFTSGNLSGEALLSWMDEVWAASFREEGKLF